MKNRINIRLTYVVILLISTMTFFTACTKEEVKTSTVLSVFGPSPALRGGELKFIGSNLDKVTAIDLPGTAEITTFVSKTSTEIVITIPQDAIPGTVTLKSPTGDITTKTPLTFSEPISISGVTPTSAVKAGDVITINGDYLNLISNVIFSDGISVDSADFVSQTRYKIEVTVPMEAQTGKISISNGAEIPVLVYSENPITVTLPTLSSMSPNPVKPGTSVQITGTDFQLVQSLIFFNGTDAGLPVTEFTVNTEKTVITATVPENVKEGKVTIVTKSNIKIESANDLTLIAPAITSVAPNPVKNGATLTITGTNLDLVTSATFAGSVDGTILSQSATSIEVTVPMTAIDGTVVLNTNSGKTAESMAITCVKPTISSIAPLSLMAGGDITITGTNLDLVKKVIFVGGLSVDVTPASETSLVVTVPSACVGNDVITLVTSNNSEVVSTDQLSVEAANKPVITGITSSVKPGTMLTITGTKLNLVESIYFQDNLKAVIYGVRTETSIEVYVPETAKKGLVTVTLNAFDGATVISPTFTIGGTDPVVDPSLMIYSFDAGWSGFTWDGVGGLGTLADGVDGTNNYYEATPWDASKYWLFANNYISYPSVSQADHVVKMDVRLRHDVTGNAEIRLMLGGKAVNILSYLQEGSKFTTGGDWKTITIPLSVFGAAGLADPTPTIGGEWGMTMWGNGLDFSGFCVDNIRYEKITGASGAPKFKLIGF